MEFSKILAILIISFFLIVIIYSMALMWKTCDTSPLAYLIPSVSGLTATTVGFYYYKAKAENLLKIKKKYDMSKEELSEFMDKLNSNDVDVY